MKQHPASKTQQKALTALGIEFSKYVTYNEAGELLQKAGWTSDGRGKDESGEYAQIFTDYRNR